MTPDEQQAKLDEANAKIAELEKDRNEWKESCIDANTRCKTG